MRFVFALLALLSTTAIFAADKPRLTDFQKNVYSQWGEDGIIEKIFDIIGVKSKVAIEFGAYDGLTLSNTANLWTKDKNWKGILIESNSQFIREAVKNIKPYNCVLIHDGVGIGKDSLESILSRNQIQTEVDILSIDIDGNDYHVFQSLEKLRPRVIICEYNPSIPANLDVYPDYMNHLGCSVAALQRVGAEKGYSLVSLTDTNAIFVIDEEFQKFSSFDTDRDHLRIDRWIAFIVSDYDGRYKVIGTNNFANPWSWTGQPSVETFRGNISTISREVIQK